MKTKIHPALAAIRGRQAASRKVDAASNVDAKEDAPLPASEATPSLAGRSPMTPADGSEPLSSATPPVDGPIHDAATAPISIPARSHTEDFSDAVIAAQGRENDDTVHFHEFNSSNIKSATFDAKRSLLLVRFAKGNVFSYENVTLEQWKAWKEAKSAGQWFHTQIRQRPKVHPFKELKDG